MRRFLGAAVLSLTLWASSAAAQEARAYTCVDTKNVTDHYWFGPGFFQMEEDRADGINECTEQGAKCAFDGTKFAATGNTWAFDFDGSTGAYSLQFIDGYNESGTCRPD